VRDTRQPATPHAVDPDGVRVIANATSTGRSRRMTAGALVLATVLVIAIVTLREPDSPSPVAVPAQAAVPPAQAPGPGEAAASASNRPAPSMPASRATDAMPPTDPADWPSGDPRDLASHFRPGDPEPTAGEVIRALQDAGDFTGLGAFNPPGTSPPLAGLAVPADFVLPPGYVRHHQVTDEGVPLEPILMFAPDLVLHDAAGRVIALPEDRVVPPELAPPGMPLRDAAIPPP
jgi:hypothetical protein